MRFWVGVTAAFSAGTLIGAGLTRILVEGKLKKDYEESVASMRRVLLAQKIDAETPVFTEEELDDPLPIVIQPRGEGTALEGGMVELNPEYNDSVATPTEIKIPAPQRPAVNPYHTPVDTGVVLSWAELDEEDYYEEDGREKEQITMVYSDDMPHFFQGGEEIEDWMDRLGGTIVDDMRDKVREGETILYIRNNQTEVDYEVMFEQP